MSRRIMLKRLSAFAVCTALSVVNAEATDISFVLTNDVDIMSKPGDRGGLDKVLGVVNAERSARGKNALFIHAGDAFSPSLMSRFDQGKHIVDLLNLETPDIFVPGNHEFDFGEEVFRQRVSEVRFPVLAANLVNPDGLPKEISPTRIVEVDGIKIGFVGGIEEDAATLSKVGNFSFKPVLETAAEEAEALRKAGADFVVAVLSTGKTADAAAVASHAFDLVLSGDDHDLIVFFDGVTAHAESASQGDYVTIVDVSFDVREKDGKRSVRWHPNFRIIDTKDAKPLPAAAQFVERLEKTLSAELDRVVFTLPTEMESTKAVVRTEEAAIGNLIADAIRAATEADVAMVNSGSIRGNKVYPAGHAFTYRDILSELPFGNTTVMIEVSGAALLSALENAVSDLENKAGRFMQVSGLAFRYDPTAQPGVRVRETNVGGKSLDLRATYKLAVNNYVLGGGDGFAMFKDAKILIDANTGDKDSNQMIRYLQANQEPEIGTFGRIAIIK